MKLTLSRTPTRTVVAPLPRAPFFRARGPKTVLAEPLARRLPVWPTVSIVILLVISVVLPAIAATVMNASLVGLAAIFVLVRNQSVDRRLLMVVLPLVGIAVIGLVSGVGAERYVYLKDAWYILNPALIMLTGYVLFANKPDVKRGLRAFIIGGVIVALWELRPYFFNPELILLPAITIRTVVGTGLYAPVAGLVILLVFAGRWKDIGIPAWLGVVMCIVLAAGVFGAFSRAAVMVMLVATAAALGCFAKREWLRLVVPVAALLCVAFIAQLYVDSSSDRALNTFGGKLAHTLAELTVTEYTGYRDINLSYRGHETAQALSQYASGDIFQLLFGRGFGSTVDLGVYLPIEMNEAGGRINVRYISVLHNGYAYILVKAGIVSIALFAFMLFYLYMVPRKVSNGPAHEAATRAARLMQAAVVALATTTYVVAGVFNKHDMFPFLLLTGFLLAYFKHQEQ